MFTKKMIYRLCFVFILFCLGSCRSSKDLIFLKDVTFEKNIKGLPVQITEHILKTGDILYVSIKSMNPDVNILFNPESNMETTTYPSYQKFTTPSGAYLYGFEIDADGNLKLPM